MRELHAEAKFQMAVKIVVELILQSPELRSDRRVGATAQQHELGALGQGVEECVTDQLDALLAVQPSDRRDQRA